jgi:hypothetical protein
MKTFNTAVIDLYLDYGVDSKLSLINQLIRDGWSFNNINSDINKEDYPKAKVHISLYKTYSEGL